MNRKLGVYIFTNIIAPYYLPVFRHLHDRLRAMGADLRIFVSAPMEPNRNWSSDWGELPVTVQRCWTHEVRWRHEQGFADVVWRHVPYDTLPILMKEQPSVVISIQLGLRTLLAATYRKLFPNSRLIIWTGLSEHSEKGLPKWRQIQRKLLLRAADAVLVNGASGRTYLENLGVPGDQLFLEPYCAEIDSHLAIPLSRTPNLERRLLYVGQLIARKGLKPFLVALSSWLMEHPDERIDFWIAGDGPLREELEEFHVSPRLSLRFLGNVDYHKLPEIYAQGGICVFPTLADEWGVVVNEALAAGLPVLGSLYAQAVEELVQDGITGWTFHPDQSRDLYAAIDRAMNTTTERLDEMRHLGRERISSLTPEFGAKCFMTAIEFVCSRSQGLRPAADFVSTDAKSSSKMERLHP